MAEKSFPVSTYNSGAVTEAEYERVAALFAADGLYGSPADPPPVVAGTGLQVLVKAGLYGNLRGFAWESGAADVPLTIAANSSGATRIDRVVLRLNRSTWLVRAAVVTGTPGAGAPALTRTLWDTGVFEELMAEVTVPNGAGAVEVTSYPVYVGSRIRPQTSTRRNPHPGLGEIGYDVDAGAWVGWDGTLWRTVSSDTGWIPMSLNGKDKTAWTVADQFEYRRKDGKVFLHFSIKRGTTALRLTDSNGSTPYQLPPGFRPTTTMPMLGFGNHERNYLQLYIYSGGDVRVYPMNEDLPAGRRIYAQAEFPI